MTTAPRPERPRRAAVWSGRRAAEPEPCPGRGRHGQPGPCETLRLQTSPARRSARCRHGPADRRAEVSRTPPSARSFPSRTAPGRGDRGPSASPLTTPGPRGLHGRFGEASARRHRPGRPALPVPGGTHPPDGPPRLAAAPVRTTSRTSQPTKLPSGRGGRRRRSRLRAAASDSP